MSDMPQDESKSLDAYGVTVHIHPSEVDPGRVTVEVDTLGIGEDDRGPLVNLYLNDHRVHPN